MKAEGKSAWSMLSRYWPSLMRAFDPTPVAREVQGYSATHLRNLYRLPSMPFRPPRIRPQPRASIRLVAGRLGLFGMLRVAFPRSILTPEGRRVNAVECLGRRQAIVAADCIRHAVNSTKKAFGTERYWACVFGMAGEIRRHDATEVFPLIDYAGSGGR